METIRNETTGTKRITIADVANDLGVSKTTVSRAISGKGRVGDDTRKRILAYIEKMEYTPNMIAKGLAQQKTFNIGLVLPDDYNLVDMPFFMNCIQGVCEQAALLHYDVMMVNVTETDIHNLERMVDNHKIDGIILTRAMVEDQAVEFLQRAEVPFVLIGSCNDHNVIQVDHDHTGACKELVNMLLQKKIQHIALIGGNQKHIVTQERLEGFMEAFEQYHMPADESNIFLDCNAVEEISDATRKCLQQEVSCIVCMDDFICTQVLHTLKQQHKNIPEDINVVSFYNSTLLTNLESKVTSLEFNARELGMLTCRILVSFINGEEVKGKTLLGYDISFRETL